MNGFFLFYFLSAHSIYKDINTVFQNVQSHLGENIDKTLGPT